MPSNTLVESATNPINGGMKAPPTIAVIIKPLNSFALSGILSTVIENINGNILAKPNPTNTIPTYAMKVFPKSNNNTPAIDKSTVTNKKFIGFIFVKMAAPEKRPINMGKKNNAQLSHKLKPSIPNTSFNNSGLRNYYLTST